MNTGFKDKFGKDLYVGVIVRYYLSDIGNGGPWLVQIVRNKKGIFKLCTPGDETKTGPVMRHTHSPFLTLVDTQCRQTDNHSRIAP